MSFTNILFAENDLEFVLQLFEVSWCLQKRKWLVLGLGGTSENPEIKEMRLLGFSHKQIEKL